MFIATISYQDKDGKTIKERNLYFDFEDFNRDTFSPEIDIFNIINFRIKGKTYQERKEFLRDLAIAYQSELYESVNIDLSYGELSCISDYFIKTGKRYGWLSEFRENGIL